MRRLPRRSGGMVEGLESRRLMSAGGLVTSYGNGGIATVPFASQTNDLALSLAQLPDGRLLVGGNSDASNVDDVGTLMRYNADGSPDPTFGGDGTGAIRLATRWGSGVIDFALFPDNSFIAIGRPISDAPAGTPLARKFAATGEPDPAWIGPDATAGTAPVAVEPLDDGRSIYVTATAVARLKADGTLDADFGTNGFTAFPNEGSSPSRRFEPSAVAIQADGSIVLAGTMRQIGVTRYVPAVRRYTASGQLDTTFGPGGTVELSPTSSISAAASLSDVLIEPGGRLLVGGGNGVNPLVAGLQPDGTLDPVLGRRVITEVNGSIHTLIVEPDGEIVGAGGTGTGVGNLAFLTRMSPSGELVTSFGGNGVVESVMPAGWQLYAGSYVVRQASGRFIFASGGYASANDGPVAFITRLLDDGSIDPSFAPDPSPQFAGIRPHTFVAPVGVSAASSVLTPDGGVVLAGIVTNLIGDAPVARLTSDGVPDAAFGGGHSAGGTVLNTGARRELPQDSAIQPDGKIVIAGWAEFYDWGAFNGDFLVARLNADGSPDTSFGTATGGGFTTSDFGHYHASLAHVSVAADGKIVAGGAFQQTRTSASTAAVVRYTADGRVDTTFGPGGLMWFDLPIGTNETLSDVVTLPDGKVLVSGHLTVSGERNRFVARLTLTGALDSTFGSPGTGYTVIDAVPTSTTDTETALGLALGESGDVFIGGLTTSPTRTVTVSRLSGAGVLDTSFGVAGTATEAVLDASGLDTVSAFARDRAGRFVFAGRRGAAGARDFLAIRLTASGSIDTSFGTNGVRTVDTGSPHEEAKAIHFPGDGNDILLTGNRQVGPEDMLTWTAVRLLGDPVPPPPAVTGVFVAGTGWVANFRNVLQSTGQGDVTHGYAIDAADQLNELPWSNLNRVSIRFDRAVNVAQGNLVVTGISVANYPISSFSYDAGTFTGVWTLNTTGVANDKLALTLTGVTDAASGAALDGKWPGTTASAFPSGDGSAGGAFRFRLNVLPGDANRSGGSVIGSDVTLVRNAQNASPGAAGSLYTIFKDLNGSATIVGSDVTAARNRQGLSLPAGEPALIANLRVSTATVAGGAKRVPSLAPVRAATELALFSDFVPSTVKRSARP